MNYFNMNTRYLIYDITRILTILIIIHILTYFIDGHIDFFDEKTLKLLLFTSLGICVYHFIIKNIINKQILDKPQHNN